MSMSINMNFLLIRSLYLVSIPLIFLYLFVPALFFFFPSAMQHIFFLNFVRFRFVDYYDLASQGVRSRGRNFYLREKDVSTYKIIENAEKDVTILNTQPTIGVWHILPASISERFGAYGEMDESAMERSLDEESHGVFIYLHGNSFDRTAETRCELYNVLSAMDFHVLAIDYRGYGDSTGHPSENGLNLDAHAIWKYAKKHAPNKDIYVWGHSMGTGVATRLAAELSDAGSPPKALVLEAPFNNLRDVVRNHPLSTPFRIMPWFDAAIVQPLIRSGLRMNSDERIRRVSCPILVLHAEDDHIIPIKLGKKLVESAVSAGKKVTFIDFEGDREFLHKFIHRAQELPDVIREFLDKEQVDMRGRNRQRSEDQGIHVEEQT